MINSTNIYVGEAPVKRVYLGSSMIFPLLSNRTKELINYATSQGYKLPSNLEALDRFIADSIPILSKLDLLYLFLSDGDVNFKTLNIINPSNYKATPYGGMDWGEYGVTNGANGYIDTNYNPTLVPIADRNYQLNSASRGSVVINNLSTTTNNGAIDGLMGSGNSGNCYFATNTNAQRINQGITNNSIIGQSNTHLVGNGFKVISRVNDTDIELINDSSVITVNCPSTSVVNSNQCLMGRVVGLHSNLGLGMYFMGGAITLEEAQQLRTNYNNYLIDLNLNPIA